MIRSVLILFIVLFGAAGCIKRHGDTPDAPVVVTPQYVQHKVTRNGETLSSIAATYTGRPQNWTKILEANPQIKPHRLPLGAVINIPAELVTKKNVAARPPEKTAPEKTDRVVAKKSEPVSPTPRRAAKPVVVPAAPVAPVAPAAAVATEKKNVSPTQDQAQARKAEPVPASVPASVQEKVVVVEQPVENKPDKVASGVGVVQEEAAPAASVTSTTAAAPPVVDRIDPAPDRERERLLDELLSK